MYTKAIRIFYRNSDNQIVWSHLVCDHEGRQPAPFPTTSVKDLLEIPYKKPDGLTKLGGLPSDYSCIELQDTAATEAFLSSDTNWIINGQLYIGEPRPEPEPNLDRERAAELLSTSAQVITMPEMWELMRIFGRLHGINF